MLTPPTNNASVAMKIMESAQLNAQSVILNRLPMSAADFAISISLL
jgi:hypothetical protein